MASDREARSVGLSIEGIAGLLCGIAVGVLPMTPWAYTVLALLAVVLGAHMTWRITGERKMAGAWRGVTTMAVALLLIVIFSWGYSVRFAEAKTAATPAAATTQTNSGSGPSVQGTNNGNNCSGNAQCTYNAAPAPKQRQSSKSLVIRLPVITAYQNSFWNMCGSYRPGIVNEITPLGAESNTAVRALANRQASDLAAQEKTNIAEQKTVAASFDPSKLAEGQAALGAVKDKQTRAFQQTQLPGNRVLMDEILSRLKMEYPHDSSTGLASDGYCAIATGEIYTPTSLSDLGIWLKYLASKLPRDAKNSKADNSDVCPPGTDVTIVGSSLGHNEIGIENGPGVQTCALNDNIHDNDVGVKNDGSK